MQMKLIAMKNVFLHAMNNDNVIHRRILQHRIHQVVKNNFITMIGKISFLILFNFPFPPRSGQNSRTSSLAESTAPSINNEGFSNFGDIIQHLQTG